MAWESLHTEKEISLGHLGITATHVRRIKSGAEYEQYFDKPLGRVDHIMDEATVHDTLNFVGTFVNKTINDTKRIAQVLKRPTLEETCRSIFDFYYNHFQYKLDDIGVEQVRRPIAAWGDRKTGIDCDCFATSVSSVLTNLGIEHYLKIIAINGRPNFQHIYVVVPKRQGIDINNKKNYWVIDPVLNHFDEEAPNITKTDYLKMSGIPLQALNGLQEEVAGLGNEFDGVEQELNVLEQQLNGLDDETVGRVFRRRLHAHVKNTRRAIERNPKAIATMYRPHVLLNQFKRLDEAMHGTEENLMGVLEQLSNEEHEAVLPHLQDAYDELHGSDDYLYGALFGDIDDNMLGIALGLGRKAGRSKAKEGGKKGIFSKIKNATKIIGSGKVKAKIKGAAKKVGAAVKKVGKILKKYNPLALAARGGMLVAMRTNFAKIAERVYWAFQTREFARSKGISDSYYNKCVQVLDRVKKAYIDKLGGEESALKKAVMNGRAAKKIAKTAKKKGMRGTTEELFGLGVVAAAGSAATVTAAMTFLAPIMGMIAKLFKGKKGGIENEDGSESPEEETTNPDAAMQQTITEAQYPSDTTVSNDGSIESAYRANQEAPSNEDSDGEKKNGGSNARLAKDTTATTDTTNVATSSGDESLVVAPPTKATSEQPEVDENEKPVEEKSGKTGLFIGLGIAAAIGIALAASANAKKKKESKQPNMSGLGNFSKKRTGKEVKKYASKKGVTMPHGYEVKRKIKTVKIK